MAATTIVPFGNRAVLPECAAACGPLYDANGGCVPPAVQTGPVENYIACFCANPKVTAFSTAVTQVCPTACPNDPNGLKSIGSWFSNFCNVKAANVVQTAATTSSTSSLSTSGSSSDTSSEGTTKSSGGGGDWLSGHWKYVVMLVVLVVAIAGIWIGACIWRRRYLRRKDRQTSLGQKHSGSVKHPSWGPTVTGTESGIVGAQMSHTRDSYPSVITVNENTRKANKKWNVTERT